MPWLETAPVEQRERFIRDHRLALYTMTELSERYGISRKTGYKWLDRFDEGGRQGLQDKRAAQSGRAIDPCGRATGGLYPAHPDRDHVQPARRTRHISPAVAGGREAWVIVEPGAPRRVIRGDAAALATRQRVLAGRPPAGD